MNNLCLEKKMNPFEMENRDSDHENQEKDDESLEKVANTSFEPLDDKKRTAVRNRFYPQNLRNKTINKMRQTGSINIASKNFNMVINPTSGTIKMETGQKQSRLSESRNNLEKDSPKR